jgi:hypothetical protein
MEILTFIWLFLGSIIGILILTIVGYSFLYLINKSIEFSVFQKWSISFAFGTGLLALTMFFMMLLGLNSRISFIPILVLSMTVFINKKLWKEIMVDFKLLFSYVKNFRFNLLKIICLSILILEVVYMIIFWLIYPIYAWDAVALWDARAKYFYYNGDLGYLLFLKEHPRLHPSYPLLVPMNLTFFYSIFFQYHHFSKIIFIFYFLFLFLFVYSSLRQCKLNSTYSLLISSLFTITGNFFFHGIIAYADLGLTFFYTTSTILLFFFIKTGKKSYLLNSAIILGLMAWVKEEGIILMLLNIFILIIYQIVLKREKKIQFKDFFINNLYFFISFLIYLPWFLIIIIFNLQSDFIYNFSKFDLNAITKDLKIIFVAVIKELLNYGNWGFLMWPTIFLILMMKMKLLFKNPNFLLFIFCILHFFLYILVYLITPLPLEWHLGTSLDRMLLHLTPIFCFLVGILLSENPKNRTQFQLVPKYLKIIISLFFALFTLGFIIGIFWFDSIRNLFINFILNFYS